MEKREETELSALVKSGSHEEIVKHPDASSRHKCISLIALERYEEALKEAANNSFEKAYCYYKVGKYKSAIKTAGKKEGAEWSSIRMQAYYSLNRYMDAVSEGSSIYREAGPILVNYSAAVAMAALEGHNLEKKMEKCREMAEASEEYVQAEVLYNLSLVYMPDRKKIVEHLKKINTADPECTESINAQICTLENRYSEVPAELLLKRNREIHEYNTTKKEEASFFSSLKKFQREIYSRERIRAYFKTKSAPAEIRDMVASARKGNYSLAAKTLASMSWRNIMHLEQVLREENINTRFIRRYLKHSLPPVQRAQ